MSRELRKERGPKKHFDYYSSDLLLDIHARCSHQ